MFSGLGNGSGRSQHRINHAEDIAVLAPIPKLKVITAHSREARHLPAACELRSVAQVVERLF